MLRRIRAQRASNYAAAAVSRQLIALLGGNPVGSHQRRGSTGGPTQKAATLVIYGLLATEIVAVSAGHLEAWRMIPTWCIQAVLLFLFASAYHYPSLRRWVGA
jgi:hypothetical protein